MQGFCAGLSSSISHSASSETYSEMPMVESGEDILEEGKVELNSAIKLRQEG